MNEFREEKDKNMKENVSFKARTNLKDLRKSAKGITLIALVITIIVLLILAGVSIAMLTGQNGILTQAQNASKQTDIGKEKEQIALAYNGAVTEKQSTDITAADLNDQFKANGTDATASGEGTITVTFGEPSNRAYTIDSNGNIKEAKPPITLEQAKVEDMLNEEENSTVKVSDGTFTLPGGFKVAANSGETVEEGIVIVDANGNEFVWVPAEVSEMANMTSGTDANGNQNYQGKLYNFTSTGATEKTSYGQDTTSYREPDTVSNYDNNSDYLKIIKDILTDQTDKYTDGNTFKKTMQEDYNKMIKSISNYHGFYVSRYEMSKSSNNTAASVGNVEPLVNDSSNRWYGLYAYGKTYTNSANSVESSMIWGSQYDAMMKWMQSGEHKVDVTGNIGDNRNTSTTTKASTTDVIKNIYDLYGCHFEWTLEALDTRARVIRGGGYSNSVSPSNRGDSGSNDSNSHYSSRLTLYVK